MIKIKIISVGKIKEKALLQLIKEYEKRLSRYAKLDLIEINDMPVSDNPNSSIIETVLNKEAKEILKHINERAYLISLCIEGKKITSVEFSDLLNNISLNHSEIIFVIGSSHGLSEEIKRKSNFLLSLSDMTFLHNFAKLILIEQVYRGFKIINNESYHK